MIPDRDVMDHVHGFVFLETADEVKDFVHFCEKSPYKCLRGELKEMWLRDNT